MFIQTIMFTLLEVVEHFGYKNHFYIQNMYFPNNSKRYLMALVHKLLVFIRVQFLLMISTNISTEILRNELFTSKLINA